MPHIRKLVLALATFAVINFATAATTYADAVQLTSPAQLSPGNTVANYPISGPLPIFLSNPLVLSAGDNTLTFAKPTGQFVISNIFPGFLSTGNAFGQGSAPITITFATGVTELGFFARPNFAGPSGFQFTFTAFNGATALNTFNVGTSGATGNLFLGVRATGGDVITSLTVTHTIPDFAIGPVSFGNASPEPIPEPATIVLLSTGLAGVVARRRIRHRSRSKTLQKNR